VHVEYAWDAVGQLTTVTDRRATPAVATHTYSATGQMTSATLPTGVQHEEAKLSLHRVDDQRSGLGPRELLAESRVHTDLAHERPEARQAAVRSQPRVRGPHVDSSGVGPANALATTVAISALASQRISAHLVGARRGC
jgi:YD repeat-containing protein